MHAGFLEVPTELKLTCDLCLMPSRDEPFGYADTEFEHGQAIIPLRRNEHKQWQEPGAQGLASSGSPNMGRPLYR